MFVGTGQARPAGRQQLFSARSPSGLGRALLTSFIGLVLAAGLPKSALAQCSASGTLTPGSVVTCSGSQTSRVGQGPGADRVTVIVNDGGTVRVTNTNSISLGNNVTITLGTPGPGPGGSAGNPAVVVQTTTNAGASGGQYGDGSNTIDVGSNSTILINKNASVIATGTQTSAEAINPYGAGNTILNYGLIQGGPSSAMFFQNVGTTGASPRNVVDNYGVIQLIPVGSVNPVTGGQAVGSNGNVGIDFINETGAKVIGNLQFQGGNDRVTLNPASAITGNFDGGGGNNLLTLNASPSSADTFAGQVKNFQTLNKTGGGTWTLTGTVGDNTASGAAPLAVNVIGGTLVLTGNNAAFNGSIVVNPGSSLPVPGPDPTATLEARAQSLPPLITDHGVLLVNQVSPDGIQPNDGTYAGVVQGTGVLTKIGSGMLTLTGANTYSGGTNLNVGAIAAAADSALGAPTAPLTFNGGTLRLLSSFDVAANRPMVLNVPSPGLPGSGTIDTNGFQTTVAQAISGAGALTKAGAGLLALTGANTYGGGTTIAAGTLQLGNGGASGSIVGDVADNGTLAFNRSDSVIFPGVISGSGGLAQSSTGTTILISNETFTGGTVVSAGALQLGNGGGTVGRVIGPILNNAALVFDRADIASNPGQISGTGTVSQIGTGTEILSAANTYTGGTIVTAGTLQIGDGATSGSIVGNVLDNATLSFNRADTVVFPGVVSGTGLLAQYGGGTTILTGANTYTGGTRIAAGTLQLGDGGTNGSIVGDVSATSGTLVFDRSDAVVFPGAISGAGGSVVQAGTGTTILTGASTYTGGTMISAGVLRLGNGGTSGSLTGDIIDNATLAFDRSDVATIASFISGTGGAAQIGTGTTILTANNSYAGGTTISAGVLQLGNGGSSGRIIGDVANSGTLVFDRSDVFSLPGSVSGIGSVVQAGTGTTILTGASTYTGGTTISAGTLQLGNGGGSGSIVGNVADNGSLVFDRADMVTFPGVISGTGSATQAGAGTTILTGNSSYTGGTTISAGTLQLGNGGSAGSITGNVADNGSLVFDRADTVTFPGVISGTGSATQAGIGITILTAISPFSGGAAVNAGTLVVGDPSHPAASLSGGGPIVVSPGATLGGFGAVTGPVLNNGTVAAGNATPGFATAAAGAFTINGSLRNQALVNLASDPIIGNTLVVKDDYASAGGRVAANTLLNAGGPLSNQVTDRLLIGGGASGVTSVRINGIGAGAFTSTGVPDAADGISVVQVAGPSSAAAFTLPGGYIDGGSPFQYHLNAYGPGSPNGPAFAGQSLVGNAGNQWDYRLQNAYVTPIGPLPPEPVPPSPGPSPGPGPGPQPPAPPLPPNARLELAPQAPAYITAPTALFNAGFQDLDSLHRRLGEIRDDQTLGRGQQGEVFVRGYGDRFTYTSDRSFAEYGFNSSQDYAATQFGGSWIAVDNASGTLRAGLAGTLGRLWFEPSAVDGASKGLFNTETLAGITTWQSRAGWYIDAIVSGGMFDGQITTSSRGQTTGMNGTSAAASIEAGYPVPLGWQGLAIEPQAQLMYQHLDFARRTDIDGIGVDLGSPNQGVFRGGARLLKPLAGPDGMLFTPYLKANLLQGIGGGDQVRLSNVGFATGQFGTALQVGGGMTGTLTRNLSVYGDIAWQHDVGGGGFRGWAFDAGLRYAFGAVPAASAGAVAGPAPTEAGPHTYLVFFDWDSATLTGRARQIVADAARASARTPLTRIHVSGYADTSGDPRHNQGLSLRRAQAVAAKLVHDGVPRDAITARGFGATRLLVPTGPGVREPQNRRVEIVLE